jgi:fatty acid desaturase
MERGVLRLRLFWHRFEAPTWILLVAIYGGWLALTVSWRAMPLWLAAPAGAWLCAWHMSLQHELMHGHPTRNARVNGALGWPPLNLWLPYTIYRESHLRHHCDATLTDPLDDPESTYMTADAWARAGRLGRWLHGARNTLLGRLLLGPGWAMAGFWLGQAGRWRSAGAWRIWLGHAAGVGLVLGWVWGVCGIDPLMYVACCVYPGTALILLRSLAEHRAAERPEDRTAVVERAGLLGLLYLHNNLHVLHHAQPGLPWYSLPGRWRLLRAEMLRGRAAPIYCGYRDVAWRYLFRPQHLGPHPTRPL